MDGLIRRAARLLFAARPLADIPHRHRVSASAHHEIGCRVPLVGQGARTEGKMADGVAVSA